MKIHHFNDIYQETWGFSWAMLVYQRVLFDFLGGASCDRNHPSVKGGIREKSTHPGVFQEPSIRLCHVSIRNLMLGQQKRPNKCNNPIVDGKHVYLKGLFLSHSCFLYICFIQNQKIATL